MASRKEALVRRANRVRRQIKAVANGRPRLSVHRSSKNIYAQIIDDVAGKTLAAASTLDGGLKGSLKTGADTAAAAAVGKLVEGDVTAQTEQACKNVMALLESQGLTAANVVKTTVFITDMGNFAAVNEVYKKYFTAPCPARSCVEVSKLPLGAQVEIEAIASL